MFFFCWIKTQPVYKETRFENWPCTGGCSWTEDAAWPISFSSVCNRKARCREQIARNGGFFVLAQFFSSDWSERKDWNHIWYRQGTHEAEDSAQGNVYEFVEKRKQLYSTVFWSSWMDHRCDCSPVLSSYCCDNLKREDMNEIRHEASVTRSISWCMSTSADFQEAQCYEGPLILDTHYTQGLGSQLKYNGGFCSGELYELFGYLQNQSASDHLTELALSQKYLFLDWPEWVKADVLDRVWIIIVSEPVHSLYLSVRQLWK